MTAEDDFGQTLSGSEILHFPGATKEKRKSHGRGGGKPPRGGGPPSSGPTGSGPDRISIVIGPDRYHEQLEAIEGEVVRDPPLIFKRAGGVVVPDLVTIKTGCGRIVTSPGFAGIDGGRLAGIASRRIEFLKYNARAKDFLTAAPPERHMAAVASGGITGKIPPVSAIINAPSLRGDGSILREPGYDSLTDIFYFASEALDIGDIPGAPPRKLAEEALDDFLYLLREFPFVEEVDRSVALAFFITVVNRQAYEHAPLFVVTATSPGTGKSYLIDIGSIMAIGLRNPVVAASSNNEELEKRIDAALLAGFSLVSLDNVNGVLRSDLISQALTQQMLSVRILGESTNVQILANQTFCATGNALVVAGDLPRRTMMCRMDAKRERPELREFECDPVSLVAKERARYVRAAVILGLFGMRSRAEISAYAGFESWSSVRRALVDLGQPDPLGTIENARALAPDLAILRAALTVLWRVFGDEPFSVRAVIEKATRAADFIDDDQRINQGEFKEVINEIAGADTGKLSAKRLAFWLRKYTGRVCAGYTLAMADPDYHAKTMRWSIKSAGT